MSAHDDEISLRHMLDHAREAVALLQGRTRTNLDADRLLTLALVQLSQIIAFRNRLIHGYDTIDFDILWQILTVNLPALLVQLEDILSSSSTQ